MPSVCMMSLWRNDVTRNIEARTKHLLSKRGVSRWVWVEGDSSDGTFVALQGMKQGKDVEIIHYDTGIVGDDEHTRMRRLSATVKAGFAQVRPADDYWLIHESDLISPPDLVKRFLATGKCPVAGWPVLEVAPGQEIFYDTWAYRRFGVRFSNLPPYHPCYDEKELFEVDSVGSVWMFHAEDIRRGLVCTYNACVELCDQLRAMGRDIWVDPLIRIVQPRALWQATRHV